MKRTILFCVIMSMVLSLISCTPSPADKLKKEYHVPSETGTVSNQDSSNLETDEIKVPKIDNETPYQELLTKEIDIHSFMEKYLTSSNSYYIDDIAADIGIECLRETDAGALYSIHKVKQGGLLYNFYRNGVPGLPAEEDNKPVLRSIYMQKKLSSKDFVSIKEGDSFDKVKKIDPVAQIWENVYNADSDYWELGGGFESDHYLSDGVLSIGFHNQNGKLKVVATRLFEDYDMPDRKGSRTYPYNGRILDTDWVE